MHLRPPRKAAGASVDTRRRSLSRLLAAAPVLWLAATRAPAFAAELAAWQGGPTPPLSLTDLAGRKHDLSEYRGRVVLLNFWATWCEPCRAELPSMKRLHEKLARAPFTVLAVNVDEPEARIRRFLEKVPLDFLVMPDPGGRTARAWSVRVLPSSFLIGRDGAIRYSVRGDVDWSSDAVDSIVAKLIG